MQFIYIFNPRQGKTTQSIIYEKTAWAQQCRSQCIHQKCMKICRYETSDDMPKKVFFLIETDDPDALSMLGTHFGSDWDAETYRIHEVYGVLENDRCVVAG